HLRERLRRKMLRQVVRRPPRVVGGATAPGQIGFVGGERFADGRRPIGGGIGVATGERAGLVGGLLVGKDGGAVARRLVVGVGNPLLPPPAFAVGGDDDPCTGAGLCRPVGEPNAGDEPGRIRLAARRESGACGWGL